MAWPYQVIIDIITWHNKNVKAYDDCSYVKNISTYVRMTLWWWWSYDDSPYTTNSHDDCPYVICSYVECPRAHHNIGASPWEIIFIWE